MALKPQATLNKASYASWWTGEAKAKIKPPFSLLCSRPVCLCLSSSWLALMTAGLPLQSAPHPQRWISAWKFCFCSIVCYTPAWIEPLSCIHSADVYLCWNFQENFLLLWSCRKKFYALWAQTFVIMHSFSFNFAFVILQEKILCPLGWNFLFESNQNYLPYSTGHLLPSLCNLNCQGALDFL